MPKHPIPKFQSVRIEQIIVTPDTPANVIHLNLTDIQNEIPPLSAAALEFLEWTQPVILAPIANKSESFKLIGGYRTYRMICGERTLKQTCQALIITNLSAERENALGIFDAVVTRAIERPYAEAGGTLAAIVKAENYVQNEMGRFTKVENDDQIAALFGLGRTKLHEETKAWRQRQIRIEPKVNKFSLDALTNEPCDATSPQRANN
jgi:hypothetical protein